MKLIIVWNISNLFKIISIHHSVHPSSEQSARWNPVEGLEDELERIRGLMVIDLDFNFETSTCIVASVLDDLISFVTEGIISLFLRFLFDLPVFQGCVQCMQFIFLNIISVLKYYDFLFYNFKL